jgi:hypothetical protein
MAPEIRLTLAQWTLGTANAAGLALFALAGVQELTGMTGGPFLRYLGSALFGALVFPWMIGLAQVALDRHVRRWRHAIPLLALPAVEFEAMVLWGFVEYGG